MANFLNLPGWEVHAVEKTDHDYRVEATCSEEPGYCPHCKTMWPKLYKHGTKTQLIMDLPSHGRRVGVNLKRLRYKCLECSKTFVQPLLEVDDRRQMTRRLTEYIERESVRRTFTAISDEVGVDRKTVRNVFNDYVEHLDRTTVIETPTRMGIDEVHLLKKPRCVLTNLDERTICGILGERTKKTVLAHLRSLPDREKVQVVTIDMWRAYLDAAREAFPRVTVVVDKFHVVRLASMGMETIRKGFRESLPPARRRRLMHDRFILLRRGRDLNDEQRDVMAGWFTAFPRLSEAYRLKEDFYDLYGIPEKREAVKAYKQWADDVGKAHLVEPFRPLLTAMGNWSEHVFAYWDHRYTNALTEALNGIAKRVERDGRGYSFEVIRAKLLYAKHLQKTARRPAYGSDFAGRLRPADIFESTYGVDVEGLLAELEQGDAHHEDSTR